MYLKNAARNVILKGTLSCSIEENLSACFIVSCKSGHIEMIKHMSEKYGCEDLDYAFYKACLGNIKVLEYLNSIGADIRAMHRKRMHVRKI